MEGEHVKLGVAAQTRPVLLRQEGEIAAAVGEQFRVSELCLTHTRTVDDMSDPSRTSSEHSRWFTRINGSGNSPDRFDRHPGRHALSTSWRMQR
jgi:hypothetical protein